MSDYEEIFLEDDQTLSLYPVKDNDIILLKFGCKGGIKVTVACINCRRYYFEMAPTSRIRDIKHLIYEKDGYEVS